MTPRTVIYRSDKDHQFYWNVEAGNGEIVAQSEGYTTKRNARKGIRKARLALLTGIVHDISTH